MTADALKTEFLPKYKSLGNQRFCNFLLIRSLNNLVDIEKGTYKGSLPNIEYLDYYNKFIILYRREGNEDYLEVAKVFRKISHKIYRVMLKKNMTSTNNNFLNLVK